MRGLLLLGFILSAIFILNACKQADEAAQEVVEKSEEMHEEAEQKMAKSAPPEIASELWKLLQTENYQEHWKKWPGTEAYYEGADSHGALLTTYVNDPAYSALETGEKMLPPGSIIVTENYTAEKSLSAITVMYKLAGFDESSNDWFWTAYQPDGTPVTEEVNGEKVELVGNVSTCIACHSAEKANDYIMSGSLVSE